MEPRHVEDLRDEKLELPEAANGRVKALRQVFAWATRKTLTKHNPAAGVRYLSGNSDGFHTWSEDEGRMFEARHPIGTTARLALALLLYTGVRRSDGVKLGRGMERDGILSFTETKGAKSRAIARRRPAGPKKRVLPILPQLREVTDATPSGHLNYLVTAHGDLRMGVAEASRRLHEARPERASCETSDAPACAASARTKRGVGVAPFPRRT